MASISVFGEPLLEIASQRTGSVLGPSVVGVAGDTLNTSVYLSRLGHDVSLITALGQDAYSDAIIQRLMDEGVSTERIARHSSRLPGLYTIRTDETGERYFCYWRDQSAARAFFELPDAAVRIEAAFESDLFYFSGISLAILPPADRDRLLAIARRCQGQVAFDGNYRPYGWQSINVARRCLEAVGKIAKIALPTAQDDNALFGPASAEDHGRRWRAYGVEVVAVKDGADGAWVLEGDETPGHARVERRVQPVDTTGAGDSFNAGFLAAWLDGEPAFLASAAGNRLAGQVIQHRGALIPHDAMP